MAGKGFSLSGFLNLQLMSGAVRNVVREVEDGLKSIKGDINLRVSQQSSSALTGLNSQVTTLSRNLTTMQVQADKSATAMESFGRQAGLAARRFGAFSLVAGTMIGVAAATKNAVREAFEFERQMIKFAQVGDDTKSTIKGVEATITSLATSFGVSSKELSSAAVTLRQAGNSARDTEIALMALAKASLAPNFGTIEKSAEGAIAIMGQFKTSAADLESQLGSMNAVSNEFAVESQDLIEAVKRGGSAFKSFGGDLNEFMALFTTVRATTRESAETIATGMRTIFARMQRSEVVDTLHQMGIELRDVRGHSVGASESIRRVGEAMSKLPEGDPRSTLIAQLVGGDRQISKTIPLLRELGMTQAAYNVALAGGSSLARNAEQAQGGYLNQITKLSEKLADLGRSVTENTGFKMMTGFLFDLAGGATAVFKAITPLLPALAALGLAKLAPGIGSMAKGFGSAITSNRVYASGGHVPGSGDGDTVPAMLTPGEFVIRKSAAQAIGYSKLAEMNRYAVGGPIKQQQPLVPAEEEALRYYTQWSDNLNSMLRFRHPQSKNFRKQYIERAKLIKSGINKNVTDDSMVVYRGVGPIGIGKMLKSTSFTPGETILDKAFVSTSTDPRVAEDFAGDHGKVFKITVPKGKSALDVNASLTSGGTRNEKEVLLPAGSRFKINYVNQSQRYVDVSMLNKGGRVRGYAQGGIVRGYAGGGRVQHFTKGGGPVKYDLWGNPIGSIPDMRPNPKGMRGPTGGFGAYIPDPSIIATQEEEKVAASNLSGQQRQAGILESIAVAKQHLDLRDQNRGIESQQKQAGILESQAVGHQFLEQRNRQQSEESFRKRVGIIEAEAYAKDYLEKYNQRPSGVKGLWNKVWAGDNQRTPQERLLGASIGAAAIGGISGYAGMGVESLAGTAEQVSSGAVSPTRHRLLSGLGGALTAGGAGAAAGLQLGAMSGAVGGPLGAAIGGIAGALTGLLFNLTDASKAIQAAALDRSVADLSQKLRAVADGMGDVSEAIKPLHDVKEQITQNAQAGATGLFGGFNLSDYNQQRKQLEQQRLGSTLPVFAGALNTQARAYGKANPKGTMADFNSNIFRAGGTNEDILGTLSSVSGTKKEVWMKQFGKMFEQGQKEGAEVKVAEAASKVTISFERLASSIEAASTSTGLLDRQFHTIAGMVSGALAPSHMPNLSGQLSNPMTPDRAGFQQALSITSAPLGEAGKSFFESGMAMNAIANATASIMPGLLKNGGLANGGENLPGQLRGQLTSQFGDSGVMGHFIDMVTHEFQRVGDKGDFLRKNGGDASKAAEQILAPIIQSFKEHGPQIAKGIEEAGQRYINGLNTINQLQIKSSQDKYKANQIELQALRIQKEVEADKMGRRGNAIDLMNLANMNKPFLGRQEDLLSNSGLKGQDALSPQKISEAMARIGQQIPGAEAAMQKNPGAVTAQALDKLKYEYSRHEQALRHMTEIEERAAGTKEKLAANDADRDSRLSFAERYYRAPPEERSRMNQGGILAAQMFQNQGAVRKGQVSHEDFGMALDFLRGNGQTRFPEKGPFKGMRGNDVADMLVNARAGGNVQNKFGRDERADLQGKLLGIAEDAKKAGNTIAGQGTPWINELKLMLEQQNKSFLDSLKKSLTDNERKDLQTQAANAAMKQGELGGKQGGFNLLGRAGISTSQGVNTFLGKEAALREYFGAVTKHDAIKNEGESLLGKSGDIFSEISGAIKPGMSQATNRKNALIQAQDSLKGTVQDEALRTKLANAIVENGDFAGQFQPHRINEGAIRKSIVDTTVGHLEDMNKPGGEIGLAKRGLKDTYTPDQLQRMGGASGGDFNALFNAAKSFVGSGSEIEKFADSLRKANEALDNLNGRLGNFNPGAIIAGGFANPLAGAAAGIAQARAGGGNIYGSHGTDTVPAMLTPGEFVVNRQSAMANAGLLRMVNAAHGRVHMADGGDASLTWAKFKSRYSPTGPNADLRGAGFGENIGIGGRQPRPVEMQPGRPEPTPEQRMFGFGGNYPGPARIAGLQPVRFGGAGAGDVAGEGDVDFKQILMRQQGRSLANIARQQRLSRLAGGAWGPFGVGRADRDQLGLASGVIGRGNARSMAAVDQFFGSGLLSARLALTSPQSIPTRTQGFSYGGAVCGPGGTDNVPAMLSSGEFVMSAPAVRRIGAGTLAMANGGAVGDAGYGGMGSLTENMAKFDKLTAALEKFPTKISLETQGQLNVVINGAEVFAQMEPTIQKYMMGKIDEAVRRLQSDKLPPVT